MKALKTVLSAWTFFEFVMVCIIGWALLCVLRLVTFPFDPHRRVAGRFFRLTAVFALKLAPMWRFQTFGKIPANVTGPVVVVSNHESNLDTFLISHLPWEMKWLAKASLFKIPFIGWSMRLAGDISVTRGTADSVVAALGRCAQYLKNGMPVCIFPEGTRSTTESMRPFKDGAFRLAIENGAVILPLAVAGTRRALAKHTWQFDFARAMVAVGEPIDTAGLDLEHVERVKNAARQQIETMLAQIKPLASP